MRGGDRIPKTLHTLHEPKPFYRNSKRGVGRPCRHHTFQFNRVISTGHAACLPESHLMRSSTPLRYLGAYVALFAGFLFVAPPLARAQAPADQKPASTSNGFEAAQVDLNLIDLPTTASLKKHQSYFRLTLRFARDLRRGDVGDLAQDFFSLDNGAVIALEYRFGILSNLQAGVHRTTLTKTIQFFGKYDAIKQGHGPVGVSVF